jgi:hypothetical protein
MNSLQRFFKKTNAVWLLAGLATLALFSQAAAQPAAEPPQRWLLIFDTSSEMKSRLPTVIPEIKNLFLRSLSGQMRAGDSIGVWTFNRKINAGEFPLTTWTPQLAANISSNIITYLNQQHYAGKTSFAALKPALNRVIDDSERLTIIIFCDGDDTLKLTPYDAGINQAFKQRKGERASLNQTFVLVVRTQRGEFVGATVNFPPGLLDLPAFPPLPAPPTVSTAPTNTPAAAVIIPVPVAVPAVSLPPLVIVGTNVGTNINDLPKIVPPPRAPVINAPTAVVVTNIPATNNEAVAAVASNPPAALAPTTNSPVIENTKLLSEPVVAPAVPSFVVPTNNALAIPNGGDSGTRNLIFIGIALLVVAIALVFFLILQRPRAVRESLITSSMQDSSQPPTKK